MSGHLGERGACPGASSAAAISLSTLFLAPVTWTSPASRAPPTTTNRSTRRTLGRYLAHHASHPAAGPAGDPAVGRSLHRRRGCAERRPRLRTRVGLSVGPGSTAATTTPTPAAVPTVQADGSILFTTPTGNIACSLTDTGVGCEIREHTWDLPPRPSDCELDWIAAAGVNEEGSSMGSCAGDTLLGAHQRPPLRPRDRRGHLPVHRDQGRDRVPSDGLRHGLLPQQGQLPALLSPGATFPPRATSCPLTANERGCFRGRARA